MKSYFINKNEFAIMENDILEHLKNGSGTMLKNNDTTILLSAAIRSEITAFQQSREAISFMQKAILVDCDGPLPTKVVLEECAAAIQTRSPNWAIRTIPKQSQNVPYKLLEDLPGKVVMKAAIKAGVIFIPIGKIIVGAVIAFLITFCISFLLLQKIGIASGIAVVCGTFIYSFLRGMRLSKPHYKAALNSALESKRKDTAYTDFISSIAAELTHHMPLVIIVEDCAMLDDVSTDVINHITVSGQMLCSGALLWLIFRSNRPVNDTTFIDKCSFSVRRFTISKLIELNDK
jgi:hypothetical protein